MRKIPFLVVASCVLISCANRIIYYGRSYSPTSTVAIFFRESDANGAHEVIGKMIYEVSAKKRSEKVQRKLIDEAKRKGADAIIFDDIELTRTGTNTTGAAAGAAAKRGFLGVFGSKTRYSKGQQIKATLLKFSQN